MTYWSPSFTIGVVMKNYIIPIFIPHYGCTHECIFCNQRKITGIESPILPIQIVNTIEDHLGMITQPRRIEVAFYGGSFTALPICTQRDLLMPAYNALKKGQIHTIRISTRPDCINAEIMNFLYSLGVEIIELGVQSLDDKVLQSAGRGHTTQAVFDAVSVIRQYPLKCGLQLMPGLPGEDYSSLINTAIKTVTLRPDFVRIYPTLVIANTKLAELYRQGEYQPLTLDQAVKRASYLKLLFERNGITVIRTGLQATKELDNSEVVLDGPYHPAFGELVDSYIFKILITQFFDQFSGKSTSIVIHHHPKDTSKVRGSKNGNILKWYSESMFDDITLIQDGLKLNEVVIEHNHNKYILNKFMLEHV